MKNIFFAWQQFSVPAHNYHKYEANLLQEICAELDWQYLKQDISLEQLANNKLRTFGYINSEENYCSLLKQNPRNHFIIHNICERTFLIYPYAIQNYFRYFPDNTEINFEEIKALNKYDYVLAPTREMAVLLQRAKVNPEKIIFLPVPVKAEKLKFEPVLRIIASDLEKNQWQIIWESLSKIEDIMIQIFLYNTAQDSFASVKRFFNNVEKNRIEIFNEPEPTTIPLACLELNTGFNASMRVINYLNKGVPVLCYKHPYKNIEETACYYLNEDTAVVNLPPVETLTIKIRQLLRDAQEKQQLNQEHSPENFKNFFTALLKKHFKDFWQKQQKLWELAPYSPAEYQQLATSKQLQQLIRQISQIKEINYLNPALSLIEIAGQSNYLFGPLLKGETRFFGNSENLPDFSKSERYDCLLINQSASEFTSQQLQQIFRQCRRLCSYIIIFDKSSFHPLSEQFALEHQLSVLEEFDIIQTTYCGNPENRLTEKEFFLIVLRGEHNLMEPDFIIWEGSQFFYNSLAVINRELELKLLEKKQYILSLWPQDYYEEPDFQKYEFYEQLKPLCHRLLLKKADFFIRHNLPAAFQSPADGYYILIFPWEFGKLPGDLVKHINQEVDQLWCPSNYVRSLHIESGVLPEKAVVVPNGLNQKIYNPHVEPLKLATRKNFRFLFLGGLLLRKGVDVLLDAYFEEFSAAEDVVLVVKSFGQDTYYKNPLSQKIQAMQQQNTAEVLLLNLNLPIEEMGKIYTACQAYVHPLRGEGFGMPIIEAMACALPVIVTNFGPVHDFCTSETAYLLEYTTKKLDYSEDDKIQDAIYAEPDKNALKKLMREVFENYETAKQKGMMAEHFISQNFNWDKICTLIIKKFNGLKNKPVLRHDPQIYLEYLDKELNSLLTEKPVQREKVKTITASYEYFSTFGSKKINNHLLAQVYDLVGDYQKALKFYSELIITERDNPEYVLNLVNILEKLGDSKTAAQLRKKLL